MRGNVIPAGSASAGPWKAVDGLVHTAFPQVSGGMSIRTASSIVRGFRQRVIYRIASLILFTLLFIPAAAQKAPVTFGGTVVDAFTRKAIIGEVTCTLLLPDSTVLMTTKSFEHIDEGNGVRRTCFEFKVPEQKEANVIVKLEAKGYQTTCKTARLVWKKRPIEIGIPDIPMRRAQASSFDRQLGTVTVKATKIKFYTRGDTLVYNADAFQLQEGSMLDALVAQLPGAELKPDGRIMVNGKFVESLLLNGRDFFKGDNTVLLDNLPAYMVHQVQVYTKESETSKLLGHKVDDGQYVMDVKLKRQYAIGWLANAEGGYGTDHRYLGRLFAMRYTPQSRLTFFGNLNNVNDRRKPDGNGDWGEIDVSGGLTATKRGGVDYSVYDKRDRYQVSGNADVSYTDNDNTWGGNSTTFLSGGDVYNFTSSRTNTSNLSLSTSHDMKFNFRQSGNAFSLSPSLSYNKRDYISNYLNGTFGKSPTANYDAVLDSLFSPDWATTMRHVIRRNGEQAVGNSRSWNGELGYWSFFKIPYTKTGLSLDGGLSFSDKHEEDFNHFLYNHYEDEALQTDWRNRYDKIPERGFDANARLKYFSHWSEEIMFNPSYSFVYKYESGDRMHYRLDVLDDSRDQRLGWLPSEAATLLQALDADNSYKGLLNRYQHNLTLDWQWMHYSKTPQGRRTSGWNVQLRPAFILEDNHFRFTDYAAGRRVQKIGKTYLLPQGRINFKRNTPEFRHELSFTASLNSSSPSMTNLVDKTFAENPLNVTLGNPDLKQRSDIDLSMRYKSDKWLQSKERQLYGNAGWHYAVNAISVSYVYDKVTGVTTSRPVNVNGNWNTWLNVGYTTPLDKHRRLTLTTTSAANYYHIVDFSSSSAAIVPLRTTTETSVLSEELRLNYRYRKLNLGLKGSAAWNHATADRSDFNDANTWNIRYGANAVVDLPLAFQLSTELAMFSRRGYESSSMNREDLVWNARLSKGFMNNRLHLMLDAWDILGNLSNVNAGIDSRSRWEYYTNVIPRYAMLRLVYRFDKQPKSKK